MKKWMYALLMVLLFLYLAMPVWADDGQGGVVFPGGNVVISPGEEIYNDIAVLGGNLEVLEGGSIRGDVTVLAGNAIVDGWIDGDLVIVGGNADLRSHAVVEGSLVTFGANLSRAEGAVVRGETIEGFRGRIPAFRIWRMPSLRTLTQPWRWNTDRYFGWFGSLARFVLNTLGLMTLSVLLVLLLPKQTTLVGKTVSETPWPSLGVGLLTMLALPFALLILVVICIGIPVAILLVLVAVAAGIFGWVAIGAMLGQRILAALKAQPVPLLEAIIGIGALALLTAVPCLGWLLGFAVAAMGLGAVVLTRFGTVPYEPQKMAGSAPQPPAPPAAEPSAGSEEKPQE